MNTPFAAQSNPFSTRFVRPGAIPYVFADGQTAESLVARLARLGWRAQIVGQHGSGKSTLVASLIGAIEQVGRRPQIFQLHDGMRHLPSGWIETSQAQSANLIIVDGYEQLSRTNRVWLNVRCRQKGWGVLVTSHCDMGLPTLLEIVPSLNVTEAVVEHLLSASKQAVGREDISRAFAATGGNLRETLFALYDLYEKSGPRAHSHLPLPVMRIASDGMI